MNDETINDVEYLVLLAVARLDDDAYGVTIREEIERHAARSVSVAAVYAALSRLEERRLLAHHLTDPTPERGGRRKKVFRLTGPGGDALRSTRAGLERMWDGVELPGERRSA